MIKRKLLITASAAVLFGCIVYAAGCISNANNTHHTDSGNTVSSWESENTHNGNVSSSDTESQSNNQTESSNSTDNTSSAIVVPPTTTQTPTTTVSPTTQPPTTTAPPTTEHQVTVETENGDVNSQDNTVFSFSKIIVDRPNYDYYTKLVKDMGYKAVNSKEELTAYCSELLNLSDGKKQVKYIITQKGLFDEMSSKMEELRKAAEDKDTRTYKEMDSRDRFLFEELGLDYQTYYSNGVATFMVKKVQDIENNVGSHSVYAIYYYSYTTKEQNAITNSVVNEAIRAFTGTDYDKVLAAQIYLRSNVNYVEREEYLLHTAYGALANKEAVCEGYAKAYKLLLNAMGIQCDVVINEDHAWNVVCLDGKWYLVDVTNDDTSGDGLKHFLLGMDALITDDVMINTYGYVDGNNTDRQILSETGYRAYQ